MLRFADGSRARCPEADRGAEIPEGFAAGTAAKVTFAREKGSGRQVFVKIEPAP